MKVIIKRKFWRIIGLSILALLIVIFFLVSPIAKSIIEKNSKEWIGRKLSIEKLWINILTGTISLNGVKVYEKNDTTVFASVKQFETSVSLLPLIVSKYKINSLSVDELSVSVVQIDSTFNFSDLLERFEDTTKTDEKPMRFVVKNISLRNSNISYTNVQRKFTQNLDQIHFSCPVIAWNLDDNAFNIAFQDSAGGTLKAVLDLNSQTKDYTLSLISKDLNLGIFTPYIRDFLSFGTFNSLMSHNLHIRGNLDKPEDIYCHGNFSLKNMDLTDVNNKRIAACNAFDVEIDSIDTKSQYFSFKKAHIEQPYLFYEVDKTGSNFDALMKMESTEGSEESSESATNPFVILVDLLKSTFQDYVVQNYSFKDVSLSNGEVKYVDKTLPEPFNYTMTALNVSSDSISSQQDKITINFNSILSNSGKAKGFVTFDPEFNNFDINYTIDDLLLSDFNPYSKFYTAHALRNGKMYYTCTSQIRNGLLTSKNGIQIRRIDVSEKLKVYAPEYSLPMRLAISLLKDINGNINLDIPIEGNLKDPDYKLGKTIWKVFKNLIFKIAASPYKIMADKFGSTEGGFKEISFAFLSKDLEDAELKKVDNLASFLIEKPGLELTFLFQPADAKEIKLVSVKEIKKRFLGISSATLTPENEFKINALTNNDSFFVAYVNKQNSSAADIVDKCVQVYGKGAVDISSLNAARREMLVGYFQSKYPQLLPRITVTSDIPVEGNKNPVFQVLFITGD